MTLFSSGAALQPTKMLRLHWRHFGLLIAVGYNIVPRADRQGAQRALAKQTPHVESDDPDSFIIALLYVDKKRNEKKKKKKTLLVYPPPPHPPPGQNSLINRAAAEREMFSGALAFRCSRSAEARSEEKMRSHTVRRVVSVSPRRSHRV